MAIVTEEIDRAAPSHRPTGHPAGYHCWHKLLFVHWRVDPALIEPLLPRELTLDTWDGNAYVGLVPFAISGLRPWWFPPLPGISSFNEINVRTYVHHRGTNPGVWFFSLDATSALAARVARWRWRLNYFAAHMRVRQTGDIVHYEVLRRQGRRKIGARIAASIGPKIDRSRDDESTAGRASGTLTSFLLDRYLLYAQHAGGPLYTAQVHHVPYCVQEAHLLACDESLLAASGIVPDSPPCHAAYCERADVEVFPLRRVRVR